MNLFLNMFLTLSEPRTFRVVEESFSGIKHLKASMKLC